MFNVQIYIASHAISALSANVSAYTNIPNYYLNNDYAAVSQGWMGIYSKDYAGQIIPGNYRVFFL